MSGTYCVKKIQTDKPVTENNLLNCGKIKYKNSILFVPIIKALSN